MATDRILAGVWGAPPSGVQGLSPLWGLGIFLQKIDAIKVIQNVSESIKNKKSYTERIWEYQK